MLAPFSTSRRKWPSGAGPSHADARRGGGAELNFGLENRGRKAYYRKNQKLGAYDVSRTRFAPPRSPRSARLGSCLVSLLNLEETSLHGLN
jgi:hypothetical protein